jgi:cytochrome c biogenesis protein CcmG/thiol:disulfide interchange protein DsbE
LIDAPDAVAPDEHAPASAGDQPPATPSPASAATARPPRRLLALLIGVVIAGGLAAFLFLGLGSGSGSGSGSGAVVGVGSVAPTFSAPSLTGGPPVDLAALGVDRHRPVVLNFFASWCGPCQQETPLLAGTAKSQAAKGSPVQFVGVDVADNAADAKAFVAKSGIIYPVAVDSQFKVSSALYGVNGMPSTFFIDSTGHVIGHVFGAITTQAELDGWLHRLAGAKG